MQHIDFPTRFRSIRRWYLRRWKQHNAKCVLEETVTYCFVKYNIIATISPVSRRPIVKRIRKHRPTNMARFPGAAFSPARSIISFNGPRARESFLIKLKSPSCRQPSQQPRIRLHNNVIVLFDERPNKKKKNPCVYTTCGTLCFFLGNFAVSAATTSTNLAWKRIFFYKSISENESFDCKKKTINI